MSKAQNNIPELIENLKREMREFTREGAKAVKAQIEKQGKEPKSGDVYHGHVASAPGESWATDHEDLIKSFTFEELILSTTVGSNLLRALYLEKGTKDAEGNVLIEPRPSVEKAYQAVLPTLENLLQKHVLNAHK